MSFTTNTSNVTGKSTTNAFNIVANSITVNKNELVKGDLTVLGNTNIGNVTLETANVDYLTVNHFTATNPVPTTSGGTGLSTIGTAGQVLQVNLAGNGLTYGTAALTNPSTITGNGFTGTPTYSMGIESTGTGTDGRGFVRTSSQAFGLDIQTSGTGKYIKLESDTVSIPQTTTPSTSTSTGALVVTGDVGIGGKINLGGAFNNSTSSVTSKDIYSETISLSTSIWLGPFGAPTSLLLSSGFFNMASIFSFTGFVDDSQIKFAPAGGDPTHFGIPNYTLRLASGTASTTIGPTTSPTSFGSGSYIDNTVYAFQQVIGNVPVPAFIKNTVVGFKAGAVAWGGASIFEMTCLETTGAHLINITAEGGTGGIGTLGDITLRASGGLAGSQIRLTTAGTNTAGVLIDPQSGGVNLSPSAGGVTANPTAGGILLQAKDTSNINIQTGTAFYPSPSASGSVIISSASGSVSIDASQQLFTVGYIAALPGSTSVPVGSNLCGAIALIASNNSAAYATGNIDLYTTRTGVNTGPGNITLNTSNAYIGLMNFTSKGLITFEASSGADLVTIDPSNFQYRFHNSGGGHCLSIDRNAAIFTFPTSTPAPNTQGFIDVNVTNSDGGCILSLFNPALTSNSLLTKTFGRDTTNGNCILESFQYYSNSDYRNNYSFRFYGTLYDFFTVQKGINSGTGVSAPSINFTMNQISHSFINPGGSNYSITFNGSNLTSSYTWKWPATMGTNGQVLVTDGSSQVYWQNTSSLGYVTGVTASSPLASSGGSAPNISISTTPTFNSVTFAAQNLADKTISAGTSYGLIFAANSPITASFRFCNSTGSTNYITVNEVYYMANVNGVLGVTTDSAKLEVVNTIAPIVAGNAINTGLFLTQNMNSTDRNVITIGKTQSGNGNCGQIYYTYDSTLTNCKFGLKFFSSSTSPTIEMQNNNTITITGSSSSSYTNAAFVINNLASDPVFSAAFLAPNMTTGSTKFVAIGKSLSPGGCAFYSYRYDSSVSTNCSSNWSMYNSYTYIQQYNNGNININTNTGSYTNITSNVSGGNNTLYGNGTLNVVNNAIQTTASDAYITVASFFAPLLTTPTSYITIPTILLGRDRTYNANIYYYEDKTTGYLYSAWTLSRAKNTDPYATSQGMIVLGGDETVRLNGATTITNSGTAGSRTVGLLNITNASTSPGCYFSGLFPSMSAADNDVFRIVGVSTSNGNCIYESFRNNGNANAANNYNIGFWNQSAFLSATYGGNITLTGITTINANISSLTASALTINNTNATNGFTGAFLSPNISSGQSNLIGVGQSLSTGHSVVLYYGHNATLGNCNATFSLYNSGTEIKQFYNGNINLSAPSATINLTSTSIVNTGDTYMSGDLNINTGGGAQTTFQFRGAGSAGFLTNASGPQATLNCCSYIFSYPQYVTMLTSGNLMSFFAANGANQIGNINTNGSNCTFNSTSDSRLKTDISPATNMLQLINQLEPVSYKWKNNVDLPEEVGFIADDLQKIIPALTNGTPGEVDDKGNPVYMSVSYGNFSPYLVGAIQELYTEIQNLKAQIALLK